MADGGALFPAPSAALGKDDALKHFATARHFVSTEPAD